MAVAYRKQGAAAVKQPPARQLNQRIANTVSQFDPSPWQPPEHHPHFFFNR